MDLKQLAADIDTYLRPDTFPLAMRMTKKEEEIPSKMKSPSSDLGRRITICQGISIARRYGWGIKMGRGDLSCPIARACFGFEKKIDYYDEGNLCVGLYTDNLQAGKAFESALCKFEFSEFEAILAAPLNRADFEPEVILIYGNSSQIMRLLNGRLYKEGGELKSSFSGRADCTDIAIKTIQTNECQVILPCYGDRVFGLTQDYEMAFTIPYSKAEMVIEGVKASHKGGTRYPIPHYLRFEPEFPEKYVVLDEMWKKGSSEKMCKIQDTNKKM